MVASRVSSVFWRPRSDSSRGDVPRGLGVSFFAAGDRLLAIGQGPFAGGVLLRPLDKLCIPFGKVPLECVDSLLAAAEVPLALLERLDPRFDFGLEGILRSGLLGQLGRPLRQLGLALGQ